MIVAVLIEQDWPRPLQEPGAPVYRAGAGAGRWVAALCVIVSALVLVPAAAPAPNTKFVSKQYGYSIVLPGNSSRWFSSLARVTWSTARSRRIRLPSTPSPICGPTGCTSSGRDGCQRDPRSRSGRRFSLRNRGPNCTTHPSLSTSKLSGTPARLLTWSCTDGYNAIGITALHAHLGYFMIVASRSTSSPASDRTAFSGAEHHSASCLRRSSTRPARVRVQGLGPPRPSRRTSLRRRRSRPRQAPRREHLWGDGHLPNVVARPSAGPRDERAWIGQRSLTSGRVVTADLVVDGSAERA